MTEGNKLMEPDWRRIHHQGQKGRRFDYEAWGSYNVIGFMADKYFAGYIDTPDSVEDVLFEESDDENVSPMSSFSRS